MFTSKWTLERDLWYIEKKKPKNLPGSFKVLIMIIIANEIISTPALNSVGLGNSCLGRFPEK